MKHHVWRVIWLVAFALLGGVAHADQVTYVYTDPQGTPLAEADEHGNSPRPSTTPPTARRQRASSRMDLAIPGT
jgi:hypothetical protein